MRRSVIVAGALAAALVGWIASGQMGVVREPDPARQPGAGRAERPEPPPFRVETRLSVAQPVVQEVVVNGHTEAARDVTLRAEAAGRVVEVPVERGARVDAGAIVLRIDKRDREAALAQAEAALHRAQIEADAARKLNSKGFQAETALAEKLAALAQAEAAVEHAKLALAHTEVRAPFAGILDRRPVEIGDYVDVGNEVATILELEPLIVIGDVAEVDVGKISLGSEGYAVTVGGRRLKGDVRYIASRADPATRTFRVELEVANPGGLVGAGMSATLHLPLEAVPAHEVSPSLLVLNESGRVGVRAVGQAGRVEFHPVDILRAREDAVWLAGLPERVRLITTGQGFVREGQTVVAVDGAEVARRDGQ
jgi:multidrug efflux system membrane fusion protein